ncbi:hypothetical protein AGLY_002489 [Aphis glycines]|uniref:Uncharacterized protein n=1 Tax=Aphis glycines TaxID=307491 RepID=A0A6G0U0D9_APHGL|nr:hypothetical protein AGLY_002489 [Aphis glycines]
MIKHFNKAHLKTNKILIHHCVIKIKTNKKDILTRILGHSFIWPSCGMVLVTTTASKHALLIRDIAAPPASGDTIMLFLHSGMFSFIHFSTAGSANKLSTAYGKHGMTAVTRDADAILQAFIMINSSINYHVSRLLNFLVTTLPTSMPNRSTIRCAKSGCDVPLNTLMFGILLLATFARVETKFDFTRHLARMGSDDNKGILPQQRSS